MTSVFANLPTVGVGLLLAAVLGPATALEPVPAGLPRLAAGEVAYERYCAECHGERSTRPVAEGPDLRRLNSFCKRLADVPLRGLCLRDVDTYFLRSVHEGKLRAGLMHMPAWKDVLPQETIWAIRSYTESLTLPPPRRLPDLPPGGAVVTTANPPR